MRIFKGLITLSALAWSTSVYAANFVEYAFTGSGSGYTTSNCPYNGTDNYKYLPTVQFTATYYVSLDSGSGTLNQVSYVGDGSSYYHSFGPKTPQETNISISGNNLVATDLQEFYRDYSYTNVSAFFDKTNLTFSDIPTNASLSSGTFSYTFGSDSDGGTVSGVLNSLTVRTVAGPSYVGGAFLAVPEPSTWATMLAGFGMIGFAARRRQQMTIACA